MSFTCPAHGDFPTEQLLKEHMATSHGVQLAPAQFDVAGAVKRMEDREKKAKEIPKPAPPPKIEFKPLVLGYRYDGACPNCQSKNIATLMVDIEKYLYAIAYCEQCKANVKQMKVHPIEKEVKNGKHGIPGGLPVFEEVRQVPQSKKKPIQDKH